MVNRGAIGGKRAENIVATLLAVRAPAIKPDKILKVAKLGKVILGIIVIGCGYTACHGGVFIGLVGDFTSLSGQMLVCHFNKLAILSLWGCIWRSMRWPKQMS